MCFALIKTETVDWALKTNYLPTYLPTTLPKNVDFLKLDVKVAWIVKPVIIFRFVANAYVT